MSDRSGTVIDGTVELAKLAPLLVAFLFFAVAVLTAMNIGLGRALETLLVGWLLVFPPLAAVVWTLLGTPEFLPWPSNENVTRSAGSDPLDVLRDRYARGEITEAEFEERIDRLLETERGRPGEPATEREPVLESG